MKMQRSAMSSSRQSGGQHFNIVFADKYLVVVNKAAGVLTVPTDRGEKNSLVDLLSSFLNRGQFRRGRLGVVHRLDRDTSGLLVFARDPFTAQQLISQFAEHKAERLYSAIVAGNLKNNEFSVRNHLSTDRNLNQRSGSSGELAISHFKVVKRFDQATQLSVRLETGKRNQIRVHCSELGHPILGDTRYRRDDAKHHLWPYRRLALHACRLAFRHPVTHEVLTFESDPPREFSRFKAQ